jgi:hypothetical protein
MACLILRAKSSDDAFSRHPKWKVARFRDMADHNADQNPVSISIPEREVNPVSGFSVQ